MNNTRYLLTLSPLERARELATQAHQGQKDKAGKPYILHPLRVSERCQTDDERIVALLHDVIEDTDTTAQDLERYGFDRRIVEAVLSVTRQEGESYEDFVLRASLNEIGRAVKLHDLEDNLDLTRLTSITDRDLPRINRYINAYRVLSEANKA